MEEFAQKKEWTGRVAIDYSDSEWLMAVYQMYGEAKGKKIIQDIVTNLKPVVVKGHLALARSVGAGEYDIALNNYLPLTVNVKMNKGAQLNLQRFQIGCLFWLGNELGDE